MSLSMEDIRADDGKLPDCDKKRGGCVYYGKWSDCNDSDEEDGYTAEERAFYWTGVQKSGGFDVEGLMNRSNRPPYGGLTPFYFERPPYADCPTQVVLYAKFGIHWYNMLQGTNLRFSCVQKYNYRSDVIFRTNYITCLAMDPVSGFIQDFQTGIVDEGFDVKSVYCFFARPKDGPQGNAAGPQAQENLLEDEPPEPYNYGTIILPEWPSENALRDKSRYYLLKKSDLRKYDQVRLYLEIAFVKANRKLKNPDLTRLFITRAAVETRQANVEPPSERLKAVNAVFYIKYKYHPNKGRARKGVRIHKPPRDRIAIIKRNLDKHTGRITLTFDTCLSETFL